MQCYVEFGYQLSICSGTKENHEKPSSSWLVAGPSASCPALDTPPDTSPAVSVPHPGSDILQLMVSCFL
jgi:hypothetical protein